MKKLLISSVVAVLFMSAPGVHADDAHHPGRQGQTEEVAVPAPADGEKVMQKMQENMKKMQAQLDRIRKTKDPEARRKLMMEYMHAMHENMMLGRGMMHGMMDCAMMKGGMMGEGEAGASPDAMMGRMNEMEKRMDMMEMMMDRMQKQQGMPEAAPNK